MKREPRKTKKKQKDVWHPKVWTTEQMKMLYSGKSWEEVDKWKP